MWAYDSTVLHTLIETPGISYIIPLEIRNKTKLPPQDRNYTKLSPPPMMPYVHNATVAGTYRFYVPMIEDGLTIIK